MAQSGFAHTHHEKKQQHTSSLPLCFWWRLSRTYTHKLILLSVVKPHWLVRGMDVLIPLSDQTDAAPEQRGVQCECVCACVTLSAGHWSICVWLRLICCCEIFRFYILSKSLQIHCDTHIMGCSFECCRKDLNTHAHSEHIIHHVLF